MTPSLQTLREHPGLWLGDQGPGGESLPTGFPELDRLLPWGGWPLGALTEILLPREGLGELRLAVPALARLSQEDRWIVWVTPPHLPYAPALAGWGVKLSRVLFVHAARPADSLWAAEQALRSGTCGTVLAWVKECEDRALRRLQLAAEKGRAWGLLFRPARFANRPSPALLRLQVEFAPEGLRVWVRKGRGGAHA